MQVMVFNFLMPGEVLHAVACLSLTMACCLHLVGAIGKIQGKGMH